MNILRKLDRAIFPPGSDPSWAWRRRMSFAGCGVFLWSIVYAIIWASDARLNTILGFTVPAFATTLATYLGIATADAHLKRETDRKAEAVPVRTEAAVAAQGAKP